MAARKNFILFFVISLGFAALFPLIVNAEGTLVVFFRGLSTNSTTGQANQIAFQSMSAQLPAGTELITPASAGGGLTPEALSSTLAAVRRSSGVVLVAYSAGYNGLLQLVSAMSQQDLMRVKSIVSLEANYNGFDAAVQRVRAVNPNVEVHRFSSGQFGTNHSGMPGSSGVADAVRRLAVAAGNDTTADLSGLKTGPSIYSPNQTGGNQFTSGNTLLSSLFPSQSYTGGNSPMFSGYYSPTSQIQSYPYQQYAPISGQQSVAYAPTAPTLFSLLNPNPLPPFPSTVQPAVTLTNGLNATSSVAMPQQNLNENENVSKNSIDVATLTPVSPKNGVSTFAQTEPIKNQQPAYSPPAQTFDFDAVLLDILTKMVSILQSALKIFQ